MTSTSTRRVVITGIGTISPLGNTKDELWAALSGGKSGVGPIESIPTEYLPVHCGGEAKSFTGHIDDFGDLEKDQKRTIRKGLKVMCREIQMGVAAAQRAMQDARLTVADYDSQRSGAVYGSDYIMTAPEEFTEGVLNCLDENRKFDFSRWATHGLPKVTPLWLLKYLPNMPASHIAIYNDLRGPNNSLTLREASSNLAVSEAYCTIVRGHADTMIAGATGTRLHPLRTVHVALQEELAKNGVPPEQLSRPFDLNRSGMVIGEGAGAIVLEELETARARNASIIGEVVGFGSSTVASREGHGKIGTALRNVLQQALQSAGLSPEEVGHIHAHGLSTRDCDREEAAAIADVFSGRTRPIPVTAAKSYFGNLGAAGGMVEIAASLMAMTNDQLFPILNYSTPDPECPVAAVQTADVAFGDNFINLNVTPQGQASAIVIARFS